MSEQIREQVSAFLDGELPDTETELLLKRLTRDGELRESFGRYALIGEAIRGTNRGLLTKGFSGRVNFAIDGEPVSAAGHFAQPRAHRWWRPFAGVSVAAGVAAIAVLALQQRAVAPALRPTSPLTAQNVAVPTPVPTTASTGGDTYVVPPPSSAPSSVMLPARLTDYVFAHSKYSSGLYQRGVLADLLIDSDEPQPEVDQAASRVAQ